MVDIGRHYVDLASKEVPGLRLLAKKKKVQGTVTGLRNVADYLTSRTRLTSRMIDCLLVKAAGCSFSEGIDPLPSQITESHTVSKMPLKDAIPAPAHSFCGGRERDL